MKFSAGRAFSFIPLALAVISFQATCLLISLSLRPSSGSASVESPQVLGSSQRSDHYIYISDKDGSASGGLVALSSTDEPSIAISSWNLSGNATVELYRADLNSVLNYLTHDAKGNQIKKIDVSGLSKVTQVEYPVTNSGGHQQLSLPLESTGAWIVKVTLGQISDYGVIVRSSMGTVVKQSENQLLFWSQDFASKRSLTSGTVKVYNLENAAVEISSSFIDSQGISQTPVLSEADIAIIEANNNFALVPLNLKYLNSNYSSSWKTYQQRKISSDFFTFTDRPVYQPGDTVYFKSIIRDDNDARLSIPSGPVAISITHGYGDNETVICSTTMNLSNTGAIDGTCKIPDNSPTGDYLVTVQRSATATNNKGTDYTYFQIEPYRKPEYFINVDSDKMQYIAGDTIAYKISGSYFFGQPLAGQTVSYTIYSSDYYQYSYYQDFESRLVGDNYYGYNGHKISTNTVVLDSKGEATVYIPAQGIDGKNQIVGIEATVTDQTQNAAFARKNVLVYAGMFGIYKKDYSNLFTAGQTAEFALIAKPVNASIQVDKVTVTVEPSRSTWVPEYIEGEKYPTYHEETETLPTITAHSNNSGEIPISFVPEKPGSYKLKVASKDERGNQITKTFYIWVSKPGEPIYSNYNQSSLGIKSDQEKYRPDATVKLQINSTLPDRDVLLTIERASVHRYQVINMSGKTATVDVPLVPTDTPNIVMTISGFSASAYESEQVDIDIPPTHKQLVISITPDKKTYAPGDMASVTVTTKNTQNQPVPAEVTLWSVDKAIYELAASNLSNIHDTFWRHRYSYVPTSHSLEGIFVLTAEMGGGCFTGETQITMADGSLRRIDKIKSGDMIKTRKSESDNTLVTTKVVSVHRATETGYLIINGILNITPDHKLWVNHQWQNAGTIQIGDQLINAEGQSVIVNSLEWQKITVPVYNLETAVYHTFFADNIWVHNEKGGGGRSVLKDTAYWNPSINTDANGTATVRFKLPDNLTTWTMTAVGATADTLVGQSTQDILVTKNVIVRPAIPNFIRAGDQVELKALVHNYTDAEIPFKVSSFFSNSTVQMSTQSAIIASNSNQEIKWQINPTQSDLHNQLTLSAISSQDPKTSDVVTVDLPIIPYGFNEISSENRQGNTTFDIVLAPDTDRQQSSAKLFIAPTLMGNVATALAGLVEYPYGCSEQTATKLYAALIAKENGVLDQALPTDTELSKLVAIGENRLAELRHADGGWGWWTTGDSNPFITAYVAQVLVKADALKLLKNTELLTSAQHYFYSFSPQNNEENVIKMYAQTLLNPSQPQPEITQIDDLPDDLLAIAALANLRNGHGTNALDLLVSRSKTQGDSLIWQAGATTRFGSVDATTGLVLQALVAGGDKYYTQSLGAVRGLLQLRHKQYWSHTFASMQAINGLMAFAQLGKELTPNFSYQVRLDNAVISHGQITSSKQILAPIDICLDQLKSTGSKLEISYSGDGQLYSTLTLNQFRTSKYATAESNGLTLTRTYRSSEGEENVFKVGDIINVDLKVTPTNGAVNYVMVEDQLPAGLIPVNIHLDNEANAARQQNPKYLYNISGFDVTPHGAILSAYSVTGTQTFTYQARVVSTGYFNTPPATAHLMYAPENSARSDAVIIRVDENGGGALSSVLLNPTLILLIKILILAIPIIGIIISVYGLIMQSHKTNPSTQNHETDIPS